MNARARIEACLNGESLDRPPVALWRHFPVDDQDPRRLATAAAAFQRTYDFDFVKLTPASSYCVKDWGAQDVWQGAHEGTREYTGTVIQEPGDWENLAVLDPHSGHLGRQLACLELLVGELGSDIPVIQTIFNPLSQAKNLAGEQALLVHLRQHPDALQRGLQIIAESTRRFIQAAKQTGISGVFYAVQHAQFSLLSEEEYRTFGRAFDLAILVATESLWLNVLHLHGEDVMFDLLADYPVQVVNWHDRETPPALGEALDRFPGAVCGGLTRWETMVLGDPAAIREEAREAIAATGGRRFILGTGCVTPITAPHGNLLAARQSVE